ncbi:MAG: hypothetical protein ACE5Q3_15915 [Alphaproteobacteria bacterium]
MQDDSDACVTGMAALSICESLLLSLTECGLLDGAEAKLARLAFFVLRMPACLAGRH